MFELLGHTKLVEWGTDLKRVKKRSREDEERRLRKVLPRAYPEVTYKVNKYHKLRVRGGRDRPASVPEGDRGRVAYVGVEAAVLEPPLGLEGVWIRICLRIIS